MTTSREDVREAKDSFRQIIWNTLSEQGALEGNRLLYLPALLSRDVWIWVLRVLTYRLSTNVSQSDSKFQRQRGGLVSVFQTVRVSSSLVCQNQSFPGPNEASVLDPGQGQNPHRPRPFIGERVSLEVFLFIEAMQQVIAHCRSGDPVFCLKLDGGLLASQTVKKKASTKAGALKVTIYCRFIFLNLSFDFGELWMTLIDGWGGGDMVFLSVRSTSPDRLGGRS